MKVSILADDRTLDPGRFRTGHGLAALLQAAGRRILLDTGGSDVFVANAERLAIDLTNVDYVFLSHGHADHTGGLPAFLQINEQAKVIVSSEAVNGNFYSRKGALHSITAKKWPLEMMEGRTLFIEETQWFPEGFGVIAAIPQNHPLPKGDRDLLVMKDGSLFPDTFGHEMALYADGLLFTGCAHSGLENILEACPWPVKVVLGGFHLLDPQGADTYESAEELEALASRLAEKYPHTVFYTGHCTGDIVFGTLKAVMGDRLQRFHCGEQLDLPLAEMENRV